MAIEILLGSATSNDAGGAEQAPAAVTASDPPVVTVRTSAGAESSEGVADEGRETTAAGATAARASVVDRVFADAAAEGRWTLSGGVKLMVPLLFAVGIALAARRREDGAAEPRVGLRPGHAAG
jgi:hypothetical protein